MKSFHEWFAARNENILGSIGSGLKKFVKATGIDAAARGLDAIGRRMKSPALEKLIQDLENKFPGTKVIRDIGSDSDNPDYIVNIPTWSDDEPSTPDWATEWAAKYGKPSRGISGYDSLNMKRHKEIEDWMEKSGVDFAGRQFKIDGGINQRFIGIPYKR
jgi:hypothetical protein